MMIRRSMTALLLVGLLSSGVFAEDEPEIPKLAVRGVAEFEKPADQLRLSIGVISEGNDAESVLDDNSRRMNKVVEALIKAGVEDGEYKTGRFQVRPQYTRRPRQADPQWKPQIVGYQVTNTVIITTLKLDSAGTLIDAASKAGANSIDSIAFDLADPRIYRAEAIATATRHAIEDATVLAEAASLKLVRVMSITLDSAQPQPPPPMSKRIMMAGTAMADAAAPIEPGDVTIRATVHIIYEIAPQE